ncbi:MAG: LysR family transcriptional regulator, partial [Candidatus Competibacterales bacterium]|nr:LysR family transcriptional regulator [Candidatus Competibacterales bacterium]
MDKPPRITLDQWRALLAVVDEGGYARAAEALHKTQSSISYAVHKLEDLLGVQVLQVRGRKAHLTATGAMLVRRARLLLGEAGELEAAAHRLSGGWEAEVRVAVDHLFPAGCLFRALEAFSTQTPQTRVQLHETVLSGSDEALQEGEVDLAVAPSVPVGFLGDVLLPVRFIAVAHPDHPLHALKHELSYEDLRQHRQLVIRDSAQKLSRDAGWLAAEQRWTVSHMSTSIEAASLGLGFAWFPDHAIAQQLAQGTLKPLPLREGATRQTHLHLIYADRDYAGPATRLLADLLVQQAQQCSA